MININDRYRQIIMELAKDKIDTFRVIIKYDKKLPRCEKDRLTNEIYLLTDLVNNLRSQK